MNAAGALVHLVVEQLVDELVPRHGPQAGGGVAAAAAAVDIHCKVGALGLHRT